jgi:hypothetical protein
LPPQGPWLSHANIDIDNVEFAGLEILTDCWGNPIGAGKPGGLDFMDVLRGIHVIDEWRGNPSLFLLCAGLLGPLNMVLSTVLLPILGACIG